MTFEQPVTKAYEAFKLHHYIPAELEDSTLFAFRMGYAAATAAERERVAKLIHELREGGYVDWADAADTLTAAIRKGTQ